MIDAGDVKLPTKEAVAILEQVRPKLVRRLVDGMSREQANAEVIEWLKAENNILSPYADYVVGKLTVHEDEIRMRREHGDKFTDLFIEMMNTLHDIKAA